MGQNVKNKKTLSLDGGRPIVENEELEDIIEKKVQERVDEKVENQVREELEKRFEQGNTVSKGSESVSRRDFLKKMGAGAAGLGALAMLPSASAFNIRSSNPLQYFGNDQDNPNFSVKPDGTLQTQSVSTDEINDGGPLSDGDGTERQIWIIANGASDPSGADSEDIIFEEEK